MNHLRLEKGRGIKNEIIKNVRNLLGLKKETIKGKIFRDIRNLFELEN